MHARTLALAALLLTLPQVMCAQTVQLSLRDGRVSIVADRATAAQILQAWSEQGHVTVVNAERAPSAPVTIRLDNVPEAEALDVLLRSAGGYLARRRDASAGSSIFDRLVITPATAVSAPAPAPAAPTGAPRPTFPQVPAPVVMPPVRVAGAPGSAPVAAQPAAAQPQGIPVAPGVVRLVGPDGQPIADDQER